MHRHGYKGRKFGLERDQRKALIKGLATSLIEKTSIETTLEKAKEIRPYVEALVTKAKKGDLHSRRQIIASLSTISAAHKLVDQIAPKLKDRQGGYLRIKTTRLRVGDNAQMATISFVDDVNVVEAPVVKKAAPKATAKPKAEPKGKE
ncbi:MAG TPA: 50S ribosomal protein L17 [Candidatus Saccharimonadales bacterium]|nr:50S ribosomal protein L17 [Candidatus Saccharimonadales bacterium]